MGLKRWALIAALMFGVPMGAACATHPNPVTVTNVSVGIEASYNVAAKAYLAAVANGSLTGDRKAQAKALLIKAYEAVHLARVARAAADTYNTDLQDALIASLTVQVLQLVRQ